MQAQGTQTLYVRLGGVYNIATVAEDFIGRIMVDPRLNANPRVDEAHHRVLPSGFKYYVTEMVCLTSPRGTCDRNGWYGWIVDGVKVWTCTRVAAAIQRELSVHYGHSPCDGVHKLPIGGRL
jgi:hypothetical protein